MSDSEGRKHVDGISAHHRHGRGSRKKDSRKATVCRTQIDPYSRISPEDELVKSSPICNRVRTTGRDPSLGHWSAPVTPTFSNGVGFEDDHDHRHAKKSVLAKVKEKAKKWRLMLAKKKHGHDDDNLTPPWGVSLDEEDEDQDPEYHGAPMYESETAPGAYKERASQHRPAVASPGALEKSAAAVVQADDDDDDDDDDAKKENKTLKKKSALKHMDAVKETSSSHDSAAANNRSPSHDVPTREDPAGEKCNSKTLTEAVTEMLTPAYTMVSGATQRIASKIQSPGTGYELGSKQMWDKGISVKEYLLHKLEPGEEDRALCQVITEAVSPRKAGEAQGEVGGMVDKVKETVSSLPPREELLQERRVPVSANPSAHESPIPASNNPPHAHVAPAPISTNVRVPGSHTPASATNIHASESSVPVVPTTTIPVSTNPRTEEEEEVETGERILQAYTN